MMTPCARVPPGPTVLDDDWDLSFLDLPVADLGPGSSPLPADLLASPSLSKDPLPSLDLGFSLWEPAPVPAGPSLQPQATATGDAHASSQVPPVATATRTPCPSTGQDATLASLPSVILELLGGQPPAPSGAGVAQAGFRPAPLVPAPLADVAQVQGLRGECCRSGGGSGCSGSGGSGSGGSGSGGSGSGDSGSGSEPLQAETSAPAEGGATGSASSRGGRRTERTQEQQREARREWQRRYQQRKRDEVRDLEAQVDEMEQELTRVRLANEESQRQEDSYWLMLGYKEHELAVLRAAKEADPPTISPAILRYMKAWGVHPPETLLRYAVDGHTDNMDERGIVEHAPDFEWVVNDYRKIVEKWQALLEAGQAAAQALEAQERVQGPGAPEEDLSLVVATTGPSFIPLDPNPPPCTEADVAAAAARERVAAQLKRPPIIICSWPEEGRVSASLAALANEARESAATCRQQQQHHWQQQGQLQQQRQQEWEREQAEDGQGEEQQEAVVLHSGYPVAGANDNTKLELQIRLFLENARLHSSGLHSFCNGGVMAKVGSKGFWFSAEQVKAAAFLVQQQGALLWQQAVLFPQNLMQAMASRMDTCELCTDEDAAHWDAVMSQLHLRSDQLTLLARSFVEYREYVEAAVGRRRSAIEELAQLQEQMEDAIAEGMAQEAASISLAIQECAAELETAAIEELAAESRLLLLLLRLMDFPAQQGALYVASWPFFPQAVELAKRAAALLHSS